MKPNNATSNALVETIDIFPTLCELTGVELPDFVQGQSLNSFIENPNAEGHTAIAYIKNAKTIRTASHRMILHQDGFVELYDHTTAAQETQNIAAQNPELVEQLKQQLETKLK
jgi:iduronate 2-sulfatase